MAKLYKVRKINFGWYHRKHDILLENLPEGKQRLLCESDFCKWLEPDPQTYEIIFRIEDMNDNHKLTDKILWNPFRETFTTPDVLEDDSNVMDWNCAICNTDILSRMDSKKVENFVCKSCSDVHNSQNKTIDKRIVDTSTKFIKHCKRLLKKEQRDFIYYARRASKI